MIPNFDCRIRLSALAELSTSSQMRYAPQRDAERNLPLLLNLQAFLL